MVSLQAEKWKASPCPENPTSKKRKWDDGEDGESIYFSMERKLWRAEPRGEHEASVIELHLDTPLPLEWQRCLDIKSGQIHYYNTRTHKRTSMDPRKSPSLDLELNLASEFTRGHGDGEEKKKEKSESWVSSSGDDDRREMVATVCIKCHMLVMMCKALPSCPNCKFVHPLEESSTGLMKPGFRLLCCKD